MSKSEIKRMSVLKGYGLPDGFTDDLPVTGIATTMQHSKIECPVDKSHVMVESSKRITCTDCGVYWKVK